MVTPFRLTLLTLLVLPVTIAQAQVAQEDSLALVALYNVTNGPTWVDNTNWLTASVSHWNGVTVTGERVTGLDLIANQLTGPIPPELGDLDYLENLFLNANQLTGPIPPELGDLTHLRFLLLEANQLTGPIPPELGNLVNLTRLRLSSNHLTELIPPELGNLAQLFVLTLNDNQLTGPIPPELGNLVNLTDLFLSGNALTGSIPAELGNLAGLKDLRLSGNTLTGSIPAELGNATKLTWLYLSGNTLTGSIPTELGKLTSLRDLILNNNPLSGTIPLSLTNLSMLNAFWFDDTSLCVPVDEAFQTWLQDIVDVRSTGCTNVAREETPEIPTAFTLAAHYPNPFKALTTIRYGLAEAALARLVVYDTMGRPVRVLVEARQRAGWHEVVFEARGLPSGLYVYRLEAGVFKGTGQMVLVR